MSSNELIIHFPKNLTISKTIFYTYNERIVLEHVALFDKGVSADQLSQLAGFHLIRQHNCSS